MRVAVFGATGRTGRAVVGAALARSHQTVAASRSAPDHAWEPAVDALAVDIEDAEAVRRAAVGVDAAVVAVGVGASRRPTTTYSRGVANVIEGLRANGARRLSVVSAAPVAPRGELPLAQRMAVPLLSLAFGTTYADMRVMDEVLAGSDLDWVCLRPPRLVGRTPVGRYQVGERSTGSSISHGDLASALLDVLDEPRWYRRHLFVSG